MNVAKGDLSKGVGEVEEEEERRTEPEVGDFYIVAQLTLSYAISGVGAVAEVLNQGTGA